MKKSLIIAIASILMLMISCGDEQPTKYNNITYDKYQIQNDTNWVEVTDIDTVDVCISRKLFKFGLKVNTESEYKSLFIETLKDYDYLNSVREHPDKTNCTEEYQVPNINFDSRYLILFDIRTGGSPMCKRRIYFNIQGNSAIYLVEFYFKDSIIRTDELSGFAETITIPKSKKIDFVKFDTLIFYQ